MTIGKVALGVAGAAGLGAAAHVVANDGAVRTWTKEGRRTIRDHVVPMVVGAATGVGGSMIGAAIADVRSIGGVARIGVIAGAGIAAAGAAYGATWGIRHLVENPVDPLPSKHQVPMLPAATPIPGDAAGIQDRNERLGRARASWTEWVRRCYGSGEDEVCRMEIEHHRDSSYLPVDTVKGRMDGYASLAEAAREVDGMAPMAITERNGRYYAHSLVDELGRHWGDVYGMEVEDPDVVAIVTPYGRIWHRSGGGEFRSGERIPTEVGPDRRIEWTPLGEFQIARGTDSASFRVQSRVSPAPGYTRLEDALGDMAARPGDQAVLEYDGKLHVYDLQTPRTPHPDREVTGLRTTKAGSNAVAMEFDGDVWQAAGGYWVARS